MKKSLGIQVAVARKVFQLLTILILAGCSSLPVDEVNLMPAPDAYGDGLLDPLPDSSPYNEIPYRGILYATDRAPASPEDKENFYLNDRGIVLRLGVAEIEFGDKELDWETLKRISLLKNRTDKFPVKVTGVDEWGVLNSSIPFWYNLQSTASAETSPDAAKRYTEAINAQLARSSHKQVNIYVHGYKVVYENPVLVSSELWHFLGYDGVFIAYAWPSTPSKFAYIKDSDTSSGFARNLRLLIEFIAGNTDAEQINLIAYSNGTRLATRMLEQLALMHHDKTPDEIYAELKLHDVILVGSDLDREVFGSYVSDGLLNVAKHLTIYLSDYDKALGFSQFLTRRQRLGQMWGAAGGEIDPAVRQALTDYRDRISFINVSSAEGASVGNGHGYFRNSPWASSDVLMTLYFGLAPAERGLVIQDDLPVYTFPPDYVSRLWRAIEKTDIQFAEAYQKLRETQQTQEGGLVPDSDTPVNQKHTGAE